MKHTEPKATLEFWREEVLRRAGQALQGRVVGLWETRAGEVVPVATSLGRPLPPGAAREMREALGAWGVDLQGNQQWIGCRIDMGRWCIAPVRTDVPSPPPGGIERRRKERMALELAGLCLGLIERDLTSNHE